MCELNGQLRKDLDVLARSKKLASTLLCLRRDSGFHTNGLILIGANLHNDDAGAELLKLMGATKFVPFKEEYLLYDREIHNRAASGGNKKPERRTR